MLKYGEINPLNVFGLRKVDHCPPHFEKVHFDIAVQEKKISDWIFENLEGRFWFGDSFHQKSEGAMSMVSCVAFELPSEASYFSLMLDQINKH
jgi:hypothetical protein